MTVILVSGTQKLLWYAQGYMLSFVQHLEQIPQVTDWWADHEICFQENNNKTFSEFDV